MLVPMWILVLANIYFGIDTSLSVGAADAAAQLLTQSSPPLSTEVSVDAGGLPR